MPSLVNLDSTTKAFRESLCKQYIARADGVLHLGAHLGSEASYYDGLRKPVLWIEAMPEIHARLLGHLQKYPRQRALCSVLGDKDNVTVSFNVSNNSEGVSSSIFEFGDRAKGDESLWPQLGLHMVTSIPLTMRRLDALLDESGISAENYDYWVLDLQGAEKLALEGAASSLEHCRALYVEVSTAEVYRDAVMWPELEEFLQKKGFVALWEPAREHDDVLFVRKSEQDKVVSAFHSDAYLRHTQRRLEHLATLGLDVFGKKVLEVGAGIGDHTSFYLDRGCSVLTSDVRPENLIKIRERFSGNANVETLLLDMDDPQPIGRTFELVHCYGLLYHLANPATAVEFMCNHCSSLLVLETCVSFGNDSQLNPVEEPSHEYSQAFSGVGCRPTRQWVMDQLKKHMPHVYVTTTQPAHPEFPLEWESATRPRGKLVRTVFVASREPLDDLACLTPELPPTQTHAPTLPDVAPLSPEAITDEKVRLLGLQVEQLEKALANITHQLRETRKLKTPWSRALIKHAARQLGKLLGTIRDIPRQTAKMAARHKQKYRRFRGK